MSLHFNSKIYNNLRDDMNNYSIDSIKLNNISNIERIILPSELKPVFEEDEIDKPEKSDQKMSSSRFKLMQDSLEDSITSNEPKQQNYLSSNI